MKTDYRNYKLTSAETMLCLLCYSAAAVFISILFYDSVLPAFFTAPAAVWALRAWRTYRKEQRQKKLYLEFKDMVQSLSASMEAGYAFENAFAAAYEEMRKLYGDAGLIVCELKRIVRRIRMNENVEDILKEFGERSGVREIYNFSQLVAVAKRTGGNMVQIMKTTAADISRKQEVELEIETMLASKRYEQRIMMVVPFFIIGYLRITNGSYIHILYENLAGRILMTFCLLVSMAAFVWSKKIVRIEV